MKIEFVEPGKSVSEGTVEAIFAFAGEAPSLPGRAADAELSGTITKAGRARRFKGEVGECLSLVVPLKRGVAQFAIAGAGARNSWSASKAELAAAHVYNAAKSSGATTLMLRLDESTAAIAAQAAFGVRLASYRFDKYRTKPAARAKSSIGVAEGRDAERESGSESVQDAGRPGRCDFLRARSRIGTSQRSVSGGVRPAREAARPVSVSRSKCWA